MGERRAPTIEVLASPVFIGSIALLVLNDHVLKSAWPGVVTGKLSDIAGVGMIALLLTAATRHPKVAFGLAASLFTLLKTVPIVAVLATPILGGTTRTDPTDVLAIIVLVPLWRWVHRPIRSATDAWRGPVGVLGVVAGVVGMTATSADCGPAGGVSGVALVGGAPAALADGAVFRSHDGGWTWVEDGAGQGVVPDRAGGWESQQSCWSDDSCVAIDDTDGNGLRVVRLAGERRIELLSITTDELGPLRNEFYSGCGLDFGTSVLAVQSGSEQYALVTMGRAGLLRIDESGAAAWTAVGEFGFDDDQVDLTSIEVSSTVSSPWWADAPRQAGVVALLLVGPAVALAIGPIRRFAKRNRRNPTGATRICVATAIVLGVLGWGFAIMSSVFSRDPAVVEFAVVLWAIGLIVVTPLVVWHRRPTPVGDVG